MARSSTLTAIGALTVIGQSLEECLPHQSAPYQFSINGLQMIAHTNNPVGLNALLKTMKGHTMVIPKETISKYNHSQIYTVIIKSEEEYFWWAPNKVGIFGVEMTKDGDPGALEGPFDFLFKLKNFSSNLAKVEGSLHSLPTCHSPELENKYVSLHRLNLPKGDGAVYLEFPNELLHRIKVYTTIYQPTYKEVMAAAPLKHSVQLVHFSNVNASHIYVAVVPASKNESSKRYLFKFAVLRCKFWKGTAFEAQGCEVKGLLNATGDTKLWCRCPHLSWFTADFTNEAHSIVLTEDIYLFPSIFTNYYVAVFILLMLLSFCGLLIWGHRGDKRDLLERHIANLKDNYLQDKLPYVVSTFTGERWNSSTTSNVAFQLCGSDGNSRVHILSRHGKRCLKRGMDDWFLFLTSKHLGNITKIVIWHDHHGRSPEWYCQRVAVYDITTNKIYTFLAERWITIDERLPIQEAQKVEIHPTTMDEYKKKWYYYVGGWTCVGMREKHQWTSIFTRHPRSLYTRCQRVIITAVLIMGTILVSMMFFNFQEDEPADVHLDTFSIKNILDGIRSVFISMTLTILVAYCFSQGLDYEKHELASKNLKIRKKERGERTKRRSSVGSIAWQRNKQRIAAGENISKVVMKKLAPRPITYHPVTRIRRNRRDSMGKLCVVLGWIISISSIAIFSFVVILYGLKFGANKSIFWLGSFLIGFISDAIILQPLKFLILAALISIIFKRSHIDMVSFIMEHYREPKRPKDRRKNLLRLLKTRLQKKYKPLTIGEIEAYRSSHLSRHQRYVYVQVVALAAMIGFAVMMMSTMSVKEKFFSIKELNGHLSRQLNRVYTKKDLFPYFHNMVISRLHKRFWYNQRLLPFEVNEKTNTKPSRLSSAIRGYVVDYQNKLLGSPSLRQIRLSPSSTTEVHKMFTPYVTRAYGWPFIARQDRERYFPKWEPSGMSPDFEQHWKYSSELETQTGATIGKSWWVFDGDGYVQRLSWNEGLSARILMQLEMDGWIDDRTRCVFFESNLYNNNLKLFTVIRLIIEALPCGFYSGRAQVDITHLQWSSVPEAKMLLVYTVLLAFFLVTYAFVCFIRMSNDGLFQYLQCYQGTVDILLIIAGTNLIFRSVKRALFFAIFVNYLNKTPKDRYVSLYFPFYNDFGTQIFFGVFSLLACGSLCASVYHTCVNQTGTFVVTNACYNSVILSCGFCAVNLLISSLSVTLYHISYGLSIFDYTFKKYNDETWPHDADFAFGFMMPLFLVFLKINAGYIVFRTSSNDEERLIMRLKGAMPSLKWIFRQSMDNSISPDAPKVGIKSLSTELPQQEKKLNQFYNLSLRIRSLEHRFQ